MSYYRGFIGSPPNSPSAASMSSDATESSVRLDEPLCKRPHAFSARGDEDYYLAFIGCSPSPPGTPCSAASDSGEDLPPCEQQKQQPQQQSSPVRLVKRQHSSTSASACEEERERSAVSALVARARAAQAQIADASQETVDRMCRAVVFAVAREGVSDELARLCVLETQLGDVAGKLSKLQRKTRCALLDIASDASCGEIERDAARGLVLVAKPVGVVGATTPSTNCEATPVIKALNAIKGRNAIVIAPHPRARRSTHAIVGLMRAALEAVGAPADLVLAVDRPSKVAAEQLMRLCDRVWATGGDGVVRRAHQSGTPALGVGQGNACVVVDATADIELAADGIARSKTFDLASSCSSDNCVLAADTAHDALVAALERRGGYVLREPRERELLRRALFRPDGQLDANTVVRAAPEIARRAGIELPPRKTFFVVPEQGVGRDHPFSGEKLSVVLALYRVEGGIDAFIELTNKIHAYQGIGHSCGIYSNDEANIMRFGIETRTSRVMVNQPQSLSNSGALWNGMRVTMSLGCGSWGRTATTDNVYWRHFVNVTYVSWPLSTPKQLPADSELFRGAECDAIISTAPSAQKIFSSC
jgi:sulfoacetaldehyde dehydrogenase